MPERAFDLKGGDRVAQESFDTVVGDGRVLGIEELVLKVLLDLDTCCLAAEYKIICNVM